MNQSEFCCWGILGAAQIARKNWQAISHSKNGFVKSVASRSVERAQTFIDECSSYAAFDEPVTAVEGYESILHDDEIDAVYIPLPTAIRGHWVNEAVKSGKHVLVEKPCLPSAEEFNEIVRCAAEQNLQVMDGVMFTHSARFKAIMDSINQQKSIGELKRITSQFSFCADDDWASNDIRGNANLEPFGALGDLGWYCIRLAIAAVGEELPKSVIGRTLHSFKHPQANKSVPLEFDGTLFFENGITSSFYCSFTTEHQQWANISGTEGFISIEDFVLPYRERNPRYELVKSEFEMKGCDFGMRRNGSFVDFNEPSDSAPGSQESLLFRDFNRAVTSQKIDPNWALHSYLTQRVLDALMKSASQNGQLMEV